MAEKDITEKILEGYNDVFADIVNVLLFGGERVIDPADLEDQAPNAYYKADGKIRELERDVSKRWKKQNIRIACIGLENQTKPDPYMPLRVAGYDGTEYRAQINKLNDGFEPYPVVTLVLYFGYRKRWDQPVTIFDAVNVSEKLKPYVNDLKINLFEIAYLNREQVNLFQSDFKIVADYFVQMRETGNYDPGTEVVEHIQEVLHLLNVMDKEKRFEIKMNDNVEAGKEKTMSEWLDRVLRESEDKGKKIGKAEGIAEGKAEGIARGKAEGEWMMGKLISFLLNQGRTEDLSRAAEDPEFRAQLYREFQIA